MSSPPWSGVEATELFTLSQTPVELLALPDRRIGILTRTLGNKSDPICPDCEPLQLGDQCPALCQRSTVSYAIYDESGKQLSPSRRLREYVLTSSSHYVGSVQAARLSDGALGVAIQLCEGPPSRSCALEYAVFSETGQRMGPPVRLYEELYGDVQLAANPRSRQVALVRSGTLATRAGAYVTILDEQGRTLRDWTRLGSSQARSAAVAPMADRFVVATEDKYPTVPEMNCPPCARLFPDCLMLPPGCASGRIAPDAGLFIYELAESGPILQAQVKSGWGSDSLYHVYSDLDVSGADSPAVSAVNRETPRPFHLFSRKGAGPGVWPGIWEERQEAAPPERELASWTRVGVMPDSALFWVGSVVRTNVNPMQSSLFAGVIQSSGAPGAGLAGSYFPGFLFAEVLTFGCAEDRGCAYAAGFVMGEPKDALGYKHYTVLQLRQR